MSRVGKKTVASIATITCIALVLASTILPFSAMAATDTTPPVTNASISGSTYNADTGWYYISSPILTLDAHDDNSGVAHTYYRINNSGSGDVEYTSSVPLPDGEYTLTYYSVDNAGNRENNPSNYMNLKVDAKPPIVNVTINGNRSSTTGNYIGATNVSITASDNRSGMGYIQYNINGSAWTNFTSNVSLPNGLDTFSCRVYDKAGNINSSSRDINVFNPDISMSPDCNKWYTYNLTTGTGWGIKFYYSPNVDHIQYAWNSPNGWNNYTGSFDLYTEGKTTIYYRAISRDGDIGDVRSIWYGISRSGPWIDCSIDGNKDKKNGWWNGEITIHINPHSNGGNSAINHTEYSWDGNSWNNYGDPIKASGKSRWIYYRTTDMNGLTASDKAWIYFAPGSYYQGSMSDSVWVNGVLYGPSSGGSGNSGASNPTSTPNNDINMDWPTTTAQAPTPTAAASTTTGSGSPLALAVVVGVLALIIVAAAAAYFFMLKPK